MYSPLKGRFRNSFPLAGMVIYNVWPLLIPFSALAIMAGVYRVEFGLSILSIWVGLLCYWVDRRHLDQILITPLVPVSMLMIMSTGLGVSFLVFEDPGSKLPSGFRVSQIVAITTMPLFMLGYHLSSRNCAAFVLPSRLVSSRPSFAKPLIALGWVLLLAEFARVFVSAVTGASDRGYGGDFIVDKPFGVWTFFSLFTRVITLGYLLVPFLFRESRLPGRLILVGLVGGTLLMHFVAGSRGQVFFPVFIIGIGAFLFYESKRVKIEKLFILGIISIVPLVTFMAHYRSSEEFREARVIDIRSRLAAMKGGLLRQSEMTDKGGSKWGESGRAFIGTVDNIIYDMTPGAIPHAGAAGMGNVIWTWVPYFLYKNRPVLQDGNFITREYTGLELIRTSIGISWPAELYRRFGYFGIPVGMFAYGLFYGWAWKRAFHYYMYKDAVVGFAVIGVFANFFVSFFWHTFTNNFWYWFYDLPKNLLFPIVVIGLARAFLGCSKTPGAGKLEVMERMRQVK